MADTATAPCRECDELIPDGVAKCPECDFHPRKNLIGFGGGLLLIGGFLMSYTTWFGVLGLVGVVLIGLGVITTASD